MVRRLNEVLVALEMRGRGGYCGRPHRMMRRGLMVVVMMLGLHVTDVVAVMRVVLVLVVGLLLVLLLVVMLLLLVVMVVVVWGWRAQRVAVGVVNVGLAAATVGALQQLLHPPSHRRRHCRRLPMPPPARKQQPPPQRRPRPLR